MIKYRMKAMRYIYVFLLPLFLLAGCEKEEAEEKVVVIQAKLQEKHLEWHSKHNFDFSQPCSMCGQAFPAFEHKTNNGSHLAAGYIIGSTAARSSTCHCNGRH